MGDPELGGLYQVDADADSEIEMVEVATTGYQKAFAEHPSFTILRL